MQTTVSLRCIDKTLQPTNLPRLTSGGKNEIRVEFTFDAHWDGFGKTAMFYRDNKLIYHALLVGNACTVPWPVIMEPGRLYVGVYGANTETVRTSEVLALIVEQGAIAAASALEPTPDIYQQVLAAYGKLQRDIDLESARIDNLLAGKTTDGELIDMRVGANGKTYPSAGAAVRDQFKAVQLSPHYADFWYLGAEFFAEGDAAFNLYLKFDTLTQRTATATNRHLWETIKADIKDESRFVTSPSGVENCLLLPYYDALVFYPDKNLFAAIERPLSMEGVDYINIAFNAWGRLENCLLSNMLAGFYVKDLQQIAKHTAALNALPTGVPDYWESVLASKVQTIHANQSEGGATTTSFAFIADVHNGENMPVTSQLLNRVSTSCDVPFSFNGGDMVGGAGKCAKSVTIADLENVKSAFQVNSNMFYLEGNHDAAYDTTGAAGVYYQQNMTLDECYNYIHRVNKRQHVTFGEDGTYFYVDDTLAKVRYICLNTSDLLYKTDDGIVMTTHYNKMWSGAIRQAQMDFIADALKSADGYAVVILSHIPLYRDNVIGADMMAYNDDVLLNMLRAAKNKTTFSASSAATVPEDYKVTVTADFTGVNVDIVGCFAGHTHYDNVVATNGINIITVLNNSLNVYSSSPTKTLGTTTECAFDIVTVNREKKTVKLTRIGAGNNRTFTY